MLTVPGVVGMAIGTRPDCVDAAILDLLESYADQYLVWIEYGLQSVHDQTLQRINRGHDFDCFQKAVGLTRNRGINICTHLILGLPGETREMMLNTAKTIARMGIDGVKLHLMYVVKGTALENLYQQGHYRCLEQQEYVDLVCDVLELLPQVMVIQRLTGDPHPQELVAPFWSLQKTQTLSMIQETLVNRDSWQGKNASQGIQSPDMKIIPSPFGKGGWRGIFQQAVAQKNFWSSWPPFSKGGNFFGNDINSNLLFLYENVNFINKLKLLALPDFHCSLCPHRAWLLERRKLC